MPNLCWPSGDISTPEEQAGPFPHRGRQRKQQHRHEHQAEHTGEQLTDGAVNETQLFCRSETYINGNPTAEQDVSKLLGIPHQGARKIRPSRKQAGADQRRQKPLPSLPLEEADQVSFAYVKVSESSYLAICLCSSAHESCANSTPQTRHGLSFEKDQVSQDFFKRASS